MLPHANVSDSGQPLAMRRLGIFDTVEVCSSSPHGPTIFFSDLASTTLLDQAPIGSIKEVVRDCQGHFVIVLREDTGPPDTHLTRNVRRTHESAVQDQKIFGSIRRTWRLPRAAKRTRERGVFSEVSPRESSRLWAQTDEEDTPAS
jgi:hypothetical protein